MRILFTFAGGSGHSEPLVPLARAAQAAGHVIAFACQPAMVSVVEAAGFTAFATGGASVGETPRRLPLLPLDAAREDRGLRDGYAGRIAAERAAALLDLCAAWQPDRIVRDEVDFGSAIIAERLGLPCATVLVIASGAFVRPALVGEPLNRLRAAYGLPPDPDLMMLQRGLVISPFPPGFRHPAFPLPPTALSIRPFEPESQPDPATPAWAAFPRPAPLVYFTLGTVFNIESGDLFPRVLEGLRALPVNILATVGREIDPQEFGPQPANLHIERYIPQAQILPRCAAIVSQGGSGSINGALAHGLPGVLIPMGADQPLNAARAQDLGLAQVLDPIQATPASVGAAVMTVLEDPSYRRAAERLRDEIATLPGPEAALSRLERLTAA